MPRLFEMKTVASSTLASKHSAGQRGVPEATSILCANFPSAKQRPLQQSPGPAVNEQRGVTVTHWPMAATSAGLPTPLPVLLGSLFVRRG